MDSENKALKVALLILGLVAVVAVVGYAMSSWRNTLQEKHIPPPNSKIENNLNQTEVTPSETEKEMAQRRMKFVSGRVLGVISPKNSLERWVTVSTDDKVYKFFFPGIEENAKILKEGAMITVYFTSDPSETDYVYALGMEEEKE